ncbi:MAG: endonuclease V [Planctomycetota bacterium]
MSEIERLAELQTVLAKKVFIPPEQSGYAPQKGDVIFSLDIQYVKDQAFVALDVQKWGEESYQIYVGITPVECEYIPQYFCFREGPPLLRVIQTVQKKYHLNPQLILIDGHGLAHPRRFGVACWIGIHTEVPSIGCAKESLLPYEETPGIHRGDRSWIKHQEETVGAILRTQFKVRPVFVSAGHRLNLSCAIDIVLELSPKYRISEPLRRADQIARAYARGERLPAVHFLGYISTS